MESIPADEHAIKRLERLGASALSIAELLGLLIGGGGQGPLPLRLLSMYDSLIEIANAYPLDLLRIEGMTRNRSARIRAALELGKRAVSQPGPERAVIRSPQDVANLLAPDMSGLPQEQMRVVHLNRKNGVLGVATVYQGSVHTLTVRTADIFRDAVRSNSTAIVVAHNHPTGEPSPSREDIEVTRGLVAAGKALDIDVTDHIVIGSGSRWVSLKERGLGFC
jgi:DNA repair protein RadC